MSPFDIRSAVLAKHARHVVLTHFPIAPFLTGSRSISQQAGRSVRLWRQQPTRTCWWPLFSVPPVVASGILAWPWQVARQRAAGALATPSGFEMCLWFAPMWGWLDPPARTAEARFVTF